MVFALKEGNTIDCLYLCHLFYVSSMMYKAMGICTVKTIYTSVQCTDGATCTLLANLDILPYWINVHICVLCVYYMCIQILAHYSSMCTSMYGMSITL